METKKRLRKLSMFFTVMLGLFLSVGLMSCGDDDDDAITEETGYSKNDVLGSWQTYRQVGHDSQGNKWDDNISIYDEASIFTFNADGTGKETAYYNGNIEYVDDFKFNVIGNSLTFSYQDMLVNARIVSLTQFELVLETKYTDEEGTEYNVTYLKRTLNA